MSEDINSSSFSSLNEEQLPVAPDKLHGWKHFAGLYAGEHIAATEFVIGATFVALGASTKDILIGLLIGNLLAVLSWTLITAPIAVKTRLSLYYYLGKIAGDSMTKAYNWANVLIFTVITAAMITVSASAVRFLFNIPAQLDWFPNDYRFVLIVIGVGIVVVLVAVYGFSTIADFSTICSPWMFTLFICGALALMPALSNYVIGRTHLTGFKDFMYIADHSIWVGTTDSGEKGIGILGIIGFAWAANTLTHVGLIDMAILRFAKKWSYGLFSGFGMLLGHYLAWIAAGIMGAGAAFILKTSITEIDPGDVAFYSLGASGFIIVIVAGWTTANANLYRAGLAAQAIFKKHSRNRVTLIVGIITVIVACSPFVFKRMLPMLTYAGLIVVPIGAIVFAEHYLFPRIGLTRYWALYKKLRFNTPAIAAWAAGLIFGFGLNLLDIMIFYYIFIPTWFFTILVYIFLAKKYGASEKYQLAEEKEKERNYDIAEYQKKNIHSADAVMIYDRSVWTRVLDSISWVSLLVIVILAGITMFNSPTLDIYNAHKAVFSQHAIVATIVYFISAYWAHRRRHSPVRFHSGIKKSP